MAELLILEFDGVGQEQYDAVNKALGLNSYTGEGDWPEGMLVHTAGTSDGGTFTVTEVWESRQAQGAFITAAWVPAWPKAASPRRPRSPGCPSWPSTRPRAKAGQHRPARGGRRRRGWGKVATMAGQLGERIAAQARRFGPLPWSVFMEAALYDPADGFFQSIGRAGRGGDFVTSPELGPLFAAVTARALDACWEQLGRPDPFIVVEAAAGAGTLARDILATGPACAPALRYVLVERSAALRAAQAERLPIELPALVLGPAEAGADADDDEARPAPGRGPLVTALTDLPALPVTGVVLANELLDNLPVDLMEWRGGRWHEVRVAAADTDGEPLRELLVPAPPEVAARATRLVGDPAALETGARIPLPRAAQEWLRQALEIVDAGRVIVIDYADTTEALARRPWTDWLRTFRQHQVGQFPILAPGTRDITCVVASDQLAGVRPPDDDRSQAAWLGGHGLDTLVAAARAEWAARAPVGDLAALMARSRIDEAAALTDERGLGGHRVLEWRIRSGA